MNFTIYDSTNGKILSNGTAVRSETLSDFLNDKAWIEGTYNGNEYYIDGTTPVKIPPKPQSINTVYYFDFDSKEWKIDMIKTERTVRTVRDRGLSLIDRMNPIWYDTLSDAKKQELKDYRRALLDLTDQPDFPINIMWPDTPSWL
jgi:hypothetical protein